MTFVTGTSAVATVLFIMWKSLLNVGVNPWGLTIIVRLGLSAIPLGYLAMLLRRRIDKAGVADLVVRLNSSAVPRNLREALASALHDPGLAVGFWVPEQQRYVDSDGSDVEIPRGRVVTKMNRGTTPVAVLIHDPALLQNPELVDAACAAASLALENARLTAELKARLNQLAESSPARSAPLVAEAKTAVLAALDELRAVCHGIHPPVLTERGLYGAVQEMTAVASVPTDLSVELPESLPPEIETVTYYVVAEALTNIGKHSAAQRSRVSIRTPAPA